MATLYLTGYEGYFSWQIGTQYSSVDSLSNPFNTKYYKRAGICTSNFSDGATSISGIVSSVNATSSGTEYRARVDKVTYSSGTYTFYGFTQVASDGKYYKVGPVTVTITEAEEILEDPTVNTPSSTATTISASFKSKGDYSYFGIALFYATGNIVIANNGPTTSTSRTFTGLSPNTRYFVRFYWYTSRSSSTAVDYIDKYIYTDQATPPTLTIDDSLTTQNSFTINIDSMGDYSYIKFTVTTGSTAISTTTYSYYSAGDVKSFSGLTPNTSYTIKWTYSINASDAGGTGTLTVTTLKKSLAAWSWSIANCSYTQAVSNGASLTSSAYTAVSNNGLCSNFSWRVWNDMVAKTKEVFDYAGYDWNTKYSVYDATLMTSSDTTLTAVRFNSLYYNIQYYVYCTTSACPWAVTGEVVKGSYFTYLMERLNVLIASL